jgi:hypothetical protein
VLNTDQNYKDCLVQIIGVHETFHFTMYKKTRSHRYKASFFDVRDIAAVAVKLLTKNGSQHENKAYGLTGQGNPLCITLKEYNFKHVCTNYFNFR